MARHPLVAFALLGVLAGQAPAPSPSPTDAKATTASGKRLEWDAGDYRIKLGGYVKVDLIHDFDAIGSTDSFDPRTIPTDDESNPGSNTRMHARQTRLNLDVTGPTSIGPMRAFVEGDFFGEGSAFRLRHAYGEIEGLLAGQTWSTFMDEDAMPDVIDFETPIAYPLIRQAMFRYTHEFGGGSLVAVALEDPASEVLPPGGVPGDTEEATPDLTARLRWAHDRGHVQLSLFAGTARYDPDDAPADTIPLFGVNLSTKLAVLERDQVYLQATWGPGVGRYRGGITAAPDSNGNLEAVTVFGAMLGYEHHWSEQWRSTVVYAWAAGDLPAGAPADANESVSYLAANLIWQFSDRTWVGIEYLRGTHETDDDARGAANRVQIAFRFNL